MGTPRAFRFMARTMTRSPLADTDPVPFRPKGGDLVVASPDGRPLRALITREVVLMRVGNRDDYVEQCTATYCLADLPRQPDRGDHVIVDGKELGVRDIRTTRVGLIDCILATP